MSDVMNPFGNPSDGGVDDIFEVNISEEMAGNMIPEGIYVGKCIDIEKKTSKAGNPMWKWDFVIIEGPHSGTEFTLFTAITPAAIWKLAETLDAFGLAEAGKPTKFSRADVLNVIVEMEIQDDEYNNTPKSSLNKVMKYSKGVGLKHTGNMVPTPGV